ncbi:hypothetical protein BKA70DRAFT_1297065 [Coprinopsis sp. MPI-PUGE-AT-0042]|nr:hypothetical protein BKA70DRAFT_1297065 [Coprinopsis sp. MPI-PUGE-AT-0042]
MSLGTALASQFNRLSLESKCVVCRQKPRNGRYGRGTTCGLQCASVLQGRLLCVICSERPSFEDRLTCGLKCLSKLALEGGGPTVCKYCLRKPKSPGGNFCSRECTINASTACLFCRSRPRNGQYHLCGGACKKLASRQAPLLLEVPKDHDSFRLVDGCFQCWWKPTATHGQPPTVQRVYKIVENREFLRPYEDYLRQVGNEVFRYHGTTSMCGLGVNGKTKLCDLTDCRLCGILKTSFKANLGNPGAAFGSAIYTSSASNKAYQYCSANNTRRGTTGALLVAKVALGKAMQVTQFGQVRNCPNGYNSVVFDRENGALNETMVYRSDAIRPVFLIIF